MSDLFSQGRHGSRQLWTGMMHLSAASNPIMSARRTYKQQFSLIINNDVRKDYLIELMTVHSMWKKIVEMVSLMDYILPGR